MTDFSINLSQYVPGCRILKWSDLLFCQQWDVHVFPKDPIIYNNLLRLGWKFEEVVNFFMGRKFTITSAYRPYKYNLAIGGAKNSFHRLGMAIDFRFDDLSPNSTQVALFPKLEEFKIRMEIGTQTWTHIDLAEPNPNRAFKP